MLLEHLADIGSYFLLYRCSQISRENLWIVYTQLVFLKFLVLSRLGQPVATQWDGGVLALASNELSQNPAVIGFVVGTFSALEDSSRTGAYTASAWSTAVRINDCMPGIARPWLRTASC
jgi:hypothetical protein